MTQINILPEIIFEQWTKASELPKMQNDKSGAKVSNLLLLHTVGGATLPGFCVTTSLTAIKTGQIRLLKGESVFCDMHEKVINDVAWYYDTELPKVTVMEES